MKIFLILFLFFTSFNVKADFLHIYRVAFIRFVNELVAGNIPGYGVEEPPATATATPYVRLTPDLIRRLIADFYDPSRVYTEMLDPVLLARLTAVGGAVGGAGCGVVGGARTLSRALAEEGLFSCLHPAARTDEAKERKRCLDIYGGYQREIESLTTKIDELKRLKANYPEDKEVGSMIRDLTIQRKNLISEREEVLSVRCSEAAGLAKAFEKQDDPFAPCYSVVESEGEMVLTDRLFLDLGVEHVVPSSRILRDLYTRMVDHFVDSIRAQVDNPRDLEEIRGFLFDFFTRNIHRNVLSDINTIADYRSILTDGEGLMPRIIGRYLDKLTEENIKLSLHRHVASFLANYFPSVIRDFTRAYGFVA